MDHTFWLVVVGGEIHFGWWLMVVVGGEVYFGWWWVVVDGDG